MEDIDKEIELKRLELKILELQKELNQKEVKSVPVNPYYPIIWPYQPSQTWICDTTTSDVYITF